MKNQVLLLFLLLPSVLATSCAATSRQRRTSVLEYLYPEGKEATQGEEVRLDLPLSVGLAFVPTAESPYDVALPPTRQAELLERVRDAFEGMEEIDRIEVVPASFLVPEGGFENVDQIRRALGVDLIALLSFEQVQFDDPNLASVTYWTILGAYVVPGNENETHTLLEATVFDVESRALLLNASGTSVLEGRTTALKGQEALREQRLEGFDAATDDLIANLQPALEVFREHVRSGTVRGRGTPAVELTVDGEPVQAGGTGMASLLWPELLLALLVAGSLGWGRRSS